MPLDIYKTGIHNGKKNKTCMSDLYSQQMDKHSIAYDSTLCIDGCFIATCIPIEAETGGKASSNPDSCLPVFMRFKNESDQLSHKKSIIKHLIFPEINYPMFSNSIIKHPNTSKIQL